MTKHNNKNTATIVLAAGLGTRMKSALPKVLPPLAGRPMIQHLLGTLSDTGIDRVIVVTSDGADDVATAVAPNPTVVQKEQLGTGHAAY